MNKHTSGDWQKCNAQIQLAYFPPCTETAHYWATQVDNLRGLVFQYCIRCGKQASSNKEIDSEWAVVI